MKSIVDSLFGSVNAVLDMVPLTSAEIARFGVVNERSYVRLEVTKSNLTERPAQPIYLRRERGELGGLLREIDLAGQGKEVEADAVQRIAADLAHLVAENPEGFSIDELLHRTPGQDIRYLLREKYGGRAGIDTLKSALARAVDHGMIVVESGGRSKRKIPRAGDVHSVRKGSQTGDLVNVEVKDYQ